MTFYSLNKCFKVALRTYVKWSFRYHKGSHDISAKDLHFLTIPVTQEEVTTSRWEITTATGTHDTAFCDNIPLFISLRGPGKTSYTRDLDLTGIGGDNTVRTFYFDAVKDIGEVESIALRTGRSWRNEFPQEFCRIKYFKLVNLDHPEEELYFVPESEYSVSSGSMQGIDRFKRKYTGIFLLCFFFLFFCRSGNIYEHTLFY